jgi:hypothetical protein
MNRCRRSAQQTGMSEPRRIGHVWKAPDDGAGWWKLAVAGPLIIMAVIIGASLGVDAWFVGFAAVIFAMLLTTLGLVLGLVRLLTRRRPATGT